MHIDNEQINALQNAMKSLEIYQSIATNMTAEDRRMLSIMLSNLGRLYRQQMKAAGHPDFQYF
jgi:hypothetical protein